MNLTERQQIIVFVIVFGIIVLGLIYFVSWVIGNANNPCYNIPHCTVVTRTITNSTTFTRTVYA